MNFEGQILPARPELLLLRMQTRSDSPRWHGSTQAAALLGTAALVATLEIGAWAAFMLTGASAAVCCLLAFTRYLSREIRE